MPIRDLRLNTEGRLAEERLNGCYAGHAGRVHGSDVVIVSFRDARRQGAGTRHSIIIDAQGDGTQDYQLSVDDNGTVIHGQNLMTGAEFSMESAGLAKAIRTLVNEGLSEAQPVDGQVLTELEAKHAHTMVMTFLKALGA